MVAPAGNRSRRRPTIRKGKTKYNSRKVALCPKCYIPLKLATKTLYQCQYCKCLITSKEAITFHSKKESDYFFILQAKLKVKEIDKFSMQVRFDLLPSQDGERPVFYKADFVTYKDGKQVDVIDVKGMRLSDYILKRKMMLFFHAIKIKEVT